MQIATSDKAKAEEWTTRDGGTRLLMLRDGDTCIHLDFPFALYSVFEGSTRRETRWGGITISKM